MRALALFVTAAAALTACGDDAAVPDAAPQPVDAPMIDAEPGPDANPNMPATLAETGLCVDAACTQIAAGVREYAPRFALWSDGASKRRWIFVPDGEQIDTTDMDYWKFPVGTKLWKEFTRDDVRVETRLLQKIGPEDDDWFMVAFAWNEAQDEAVAEPFGDTNVLGTEHDIPGRSDCRKCHDRLSSRILGVGAVQLDYAAPEALLDLADLVSLDWLTVEPTLTGGIAYPLPGDATAQAAIGYLHANCGNCHNPTTDINTTLIDLRLRVGLLGTVEATPIYTSTVDVAPQINLAGATAVIEPGVPSASAVHLRITSTSSAQQMPPIGREIVDTTGADAVAAWITSLAP